MMWFPPPLEWLNCIIHHIAFIHSAAKEHLDWFYLLIVVYSAAVNMDVQAPLWHADLDWFGYIPRSS